MKTKKILFGSTLLAAAALNFCAASANADTYTWAGTGEDSASWDTATSNWTTGGDDPVAWVNSSSNDATFTDDATNQSVTIDGLISAHTVEIAGGEYTFTLGGSGSLSAKAFLKVDDGASLTVAGEGTVKFTSNATIGKKASLTISGGDFGVYGSVKIDEGGSIEITDGDVLFNYTVAIGSGAELKISGGSLTTNYTTTVDGGSIEITDGDALFKYTVAVSSGGSIEISGGDTTFSKAVTVSGEDSSINISDGSVSFNGDVTLSDGASLNLNGGSVAFNGKVDLSEAISNSGTITVDTDDVTFVVNDSLLDEGKNFTYTFITNTEADETTQTPAGTIVGWDNLTAENFVIDENLYTLADDIGVVLKADGQATVVFVTESEDGTATVDYDYYIDYQRYWDSRFYCIGIEVDGTVGSFTLQDLTNGGDGNYAITDKDVLFIGSGATDGEGNLVDSVTITEANISNGPYTSGTTSTKKVFAVEGCTVIIDGLKISELGMNIVVGTMYGAGDAELVITNGASVTTGAYLNTIGSNLNTGTVTIEKGSTLATQQITLGGGVGSLISGGEKEGTYLTTYFYDQETYEKVVRATLVSGESFEGSYGIVNVKSGSTFSVGVGNTDHSINKFQLSNGELNVDGAGSQMIIGSNSCFLLMGEWAFTNSSATGSEYGLYTGIVYNEKINVTGGGKITNEEGTGLYALYLGEDFIAANTTVEISVSGSDDNGNASSFDLTSTNSAHIGAVSGYDDTYKAYGNNYIIKDGGTMDVTISASKGGEFKITANGIFVCADNYETYLVSGGDEKDVGHSYGIDVKLSATDGGSLELNSVSGGTVLLAAGSPLTKDEDGDETGYTNTLTIKADGTSEEGTASSVTISGGDIYTNFGDAGEGAAAVSVKITATTGGTIALKAAKVEDTGNGVISFGLNTTVTVEENSSLTTSGTTISFETGSSLIVNAGGSWTSSGSVTVAAGASMDLNGTIDLSEAIQNSGSVTVNSDVVFVLKDSLLAEGSQYTYTLVVNELITDEETGETGSGTIVDWSTLTKDNFVYADGDALGDNIDVSVDVDGYVTLLYKEGGVTIDYEYKTPWQRGTHGLSGIEESGLDLYYFRAIKFEVSGTTDNFVLQDQTNTTGNYAITGKNLYFVGSAEKDSEGNLVDSVTITSANIDNGTYTSYHATQDSFVVEGCTVIFDGKASANDGTSQLVIADLVMNLSIGTKADAELVITDGAQVKTGAAYNTVGANLAVGTITISGTDSVLDNQQITLGSAVSSEFGVSSSRAEDGAYWIQFIETDTEYDAVLAAITASDFDPTSGSYGIVNVESGGTWKVGVGNTDYSVNKLQLSNGEINVSGEGSELILGSRSSLLMMGESYNLAYGLKNSETVSVTGGGKISSDNTTETTNGTGVMQLIIGDNTYDSKDTVKISADGEGSSFDVYVGNKYSGGYVAVYIGTYGGYWDQKDDVEAGTVDVNISASDGGEVKISTEGAIAVAADNYVTYIAEYSSETSSNETSANSSHGLTVAITAEVGDGGTAAGTVVLSAAGDVLLAAGSAAEGYSNSVTVKADGSVTDEEDNEISSSVTISGANIYTNMHEADNVTVTITASNGGAISLIATSNDTDADGIVLNKNTTVIIEEGSSLTLSGVVTLAEGASMNLNGTIDLSNQIQNSGEVTVGEDVVFLLKEDDVNFKDEDKHFNFTYDFIINTPADETAQTTGGSIKGWDNLTIDNFSIVASDENNEVPENLGIVTKADGQATVVFVTESENGTATVDYDYYIDYQRTWDGRFYCIGITVDGTVDSFVLQDRTSITGNLDEITKDITGKDVLFIGSGATDADGKLVDSVTITSANISNTGSSTNAFAVEGTKVIIDGQASDNEGASQIVISELGMNIVVGTMYGAGDAELVITNGASVTTSAYYNTVGSNLNTGTITITGEGSLLANQQITLGGGVNSLFAATAASGQYQTKYFVDTDTYNDDIRDTIVSSKFDPTSGSYGIVNVTDGGTWKVGVGNTNSSNNRIQLANGEINIDGGSLIFGKNSSLLMMNESLFGTTTDEGKTAAYTGMNISEKVTVTNGGTVSVEENGTMAQLVIGDAYVASNVTAAVSVDGSDSDGNASSFIISASTAVYIGTNSGCWTNTSTQTSVYEGGTADVTVSATNGGVIDISSAGGMVICADNYATYIGATADGKIYSEAGHSYGLKVALTAEDGGSLTLSGGESGNIDIGAGSPSEGKKSSLTVSSTGTNSTLSISGKNITANYESSNLTSSYVATKGGSLELSATNQVVLGYGTSTGSSISVQAGTAEDKDSGAYSTVSISGSVVYTNYLTSGLTTSFGAYEGGTLTISAEREIALGVGLDPQANSADDATSGGSMSITADGAGSKVEISVAGTDGNQAIFINYETQEFTSTITASNGGSISMSAGEVAIGYSQSTSGVSPSGSATVTATGENSEITISATGDISTNTKGSKDLSVKITATKGGTINLIAGETADEPTPGSIKPLDDSDTGTIYLGNNTAVKVDADSTLNTTGAVTFDAGSSLTLAKDGSWTSNGSVTVAEEASMNLNGRVDLSETIQNSGSVTVNSDVVFVLNDSLKVEGTSATYAIIEGGTITSWDTLGTSNFTYSDSALATNVVLDLTTDGYVTLLYKEGGVTINYDYETPWNRGTHGLSGIEKSGLDLYYFRAMHIEIEEGASVGGFTLQDANETAITSKNVYITGSGKDSSTLTITNINVSNESAGYYAFVVENATVVINGTDVKVDELGMSLCIGTMDSAELQITGGAQVSTSGVWSTIGSNMATGTLTISGEGSSLTNAQINIGMATTSLSGMSDSTAAAGVDGYYYANYIETDDAYNAVIAALTGENYQPADGSYGIVNVKEGGTWTISGSSTSNSRIQLSNGEINIDGEGSSLIFGKNSSLIMGNMTSSSDYNYTVSETLNVTNGGTVKAADDVVLYQFYVGQVRDASKGEATISVDGEGSSFKVSSQYVYIGLKNETTSGGTETVNISATNGGIFDITSTGSSLIVGYGYGDGASDKMDVHITADSGGSINLATTKGTVYFGYYAQTTSSSGDATNVTEVTAYANSAVSISSGADAETAGTIYFGYAAANGSDSVTADGGTVEIYAKNLNVGWQTVDYSSTFTAKNGGTLNIETTNQVVLGYYYYKAASTDRTITVEATGSGSVVDIATGIFVTNWDTTNDCTTDIKATDGGSIYIEASSGVYFGFTQYSHSSYIGYGTVNIESTGDGSLVDISASSSSSYIYFNGYESSNLAVNISASDGGALIFSGTQVQFCANTKVEISSGGTLSTTATLFENTSSLSLAATSYWLSDGLATVEEGAELKLNGRVEVTTAISNEGTITVSGSSLFVLSSALQDETDESGNTYIVIVTDQDSVETWHNLTAANFIFDDGTTLGRSVVDVSTDGVVTITEELESATLIWNGKESLHEWDTDKNDKDWKNGPQDDSFYTGDNVIFNEVAEDKDVLIHEQNLVAGTITVEVSEEAKEADPETTIEYTFDFDNKASLEGESLSVGDGASLTVTGDGSLEIDGETDIAGDMTVTGGAKANFDDGVTIDGTGSLTVTSDEETGASGSVNVSGDLDVEGSLSVEDGSLTLTSNENAGTTGDLTVHGSLDVSGGTVEANGLTLSKDETGTDGASAEFSGGETTINGDVTVDSDSSLTVSGGTLTADSVEVEGTLDFEGGTLNTGELTIASDDKTTLKGGDLNIGSLTVEDEGGVTFGDGLTVGVYGDDDLDLDLDINLDGSVGFDTSNGDITIEGTLSDGETEGSLTKTGEGTLTLDGENTYTGGTTIDEGTIEADNTDALGTGEVDIHKGATLKIHSHDDSGNPDEFSNSTTGEGTLELVEGEINLGDVGVQNVVVDKDATLEGDTTLTHSDASLDLAGTLEINVDEGEHITISDSGKVIIEDTATLDLDDDPTFKAGDSFVIVDGGTVTGDIEHFLGTDDSISTAAESFAVIYDTSNGLSVSISKTGEQSVPYMRLHDGLYSDFIAAVITAEDMTLTAGIQGTGDVSSNPIARELLNGNVSRAIEMLNTLAPNDYAAMIAMPTTAFHNDVSSIDKRLAAVRAMPFSEDENARWGYFAQADGTFADNDNANDTPTFDFQLYGVLAGADYRMSNTLTVGVALGYDHEHAKLHNSGGRIDGDDVRVTVYAGAQLTDTVYANVGAQVGYGYYEARRHTVMGRASGETEGYNAGVFADVGMDLPLSEKHGISARPYVGLAYLRSFVSGFDDNLFDIGSFNNDSLRARVGLGVFWDLDGVSLGIDTSFSHDFCGEEIDDMSATYRATGSKFSMMAECLPEDVFSVGPVVSVGISEGLSAFAGYSFQAGSNEYIGHNVYIGVRASF